MSRKWTLTNTIGLFKILPIQPFCSGGFPSVLKKNLRIQGPTGREDICLAGSVHPIRRSQVGYPDCHSLLVYISQQARIFWRMADEDRKSCPNLSELTRRYWTNQTASDYNIFTMEFELQFLACGSYKNGNLSHSLFGSLRVWLNITFWIGI